jgi:hypothetical protein
MKKGCLFVFGLGVIAVALTVFIRTRPIDVEIVPLPRQPEDNSYYAISRLALRTEGAGEKSLVLRHGRDDLPFAGDEDLRANFMVEIADFREQYLPLIGKPYMPPKRFSSYEKPDLNDGLIYWAVAEAVVLDDLLRSNDYDGAAKQLNRALRFSQQISNHEDFGGMLSGIIMASKALYVLEAHIRDIPHGKSAMFAGALVDAEATAPRFEDHMNAEEASSILDLREESKRSKDIWWNSLFNYRGVARTVAREYQRMRDQADVPITKRSAAPEALGHAYLYVDPGFSQDIFDRTKVQLQMHYVALRIRAFRHVNGTYPKQLNEIDLDGYAIDKFTGDELIYRTGDKGFLVYARGYDGDDDRGKRYSAPMGDGDYGVLTRGKDEIEPNTRLAPPLWLK